MGYAEQVDRAKVSEDALKRACESASVPTAGIEEMIVALCAIYQPMRKVARCDVCGGHSDPALPECPFCGDGAEVAGAAVEPAQKAEATKTNGHAPNGAASNGHATPSAKKRSPKKKDAPNDVQVGPQVPAPSAAAIVVAEPTPVLVEIVAKSSKLDQAVEKIQSLCVEALDFVRSAKLRAYRIGGVLAGLVDDQEWKQCLTVEGQPRFRSFDSWYDVVVKPVCGMSLQHAWRAIDVAREFTEEQVIGIGFGKLSLLLEAPKDYRAEIEEKLQEGPNYQQARDLVNDAKRKGATGYAKSRRESADAKADSKKHAGAGERITVSKIEGTRTIKLFAKGSDAKRAKSLTDEPHGDVDLENDVRQTFSIVKAADGLVLKIKTKRVG